MEACRFLPELVADVNAVDNNGETATHGVAYQSRDHLVPLFAARRAGINLWNRKNKFG